jgi:hypothetical protein
MNKRARSRLLFACAGIVALLLATTPSGAQVPLAAATAPSRAQVTVTVTNTYAADELRGVQPDGGVISVPDAQPGRYATKINVHNNTGLDIRFRKKVIQLKGGQVPFEPTFRRVEGLSPDWAMEVVCRDIYSHLNIVVGPNQPPPYIAGFVIFEVFFGQPLPTNIPDDPLDVEGIYTYYGPPFTQGVSIDVEVFPAKRNRHNIVL